MDIGQATKCNNITILVEGNIIIDNGEYNIIDCNETENNLWYCLCDGGFNVTLQTKQNTINKYNITINYTIEKENVVVNTGGSGGNSRGYINKNNVCIEKWVCTEWSECVNTFKKRECIDVNNCSNITINESNKCISSIYIDKNINISNYTFSNNTHNNNNENNNLNNINDIIPENKNTKNKNIILLMIEILIVVGIVCFIFYLQTKKKTF